jgi:DNA mismatch endonuclease, patch repair protein
MRANRRVSGAEIRFRRAVWAEGARGFRRGEFLPGRPDVIFSRLRLAVFIHGCYWHRCPTCNLALPKANRDFWQAKFEANLARDRQAQVALAQRGWDTITIWEHDLKSDIRAAARRLADQVAARRGTT